MTSYLITCYLLIEFLINAYYQNIEIIKGMREIRLLESDDARFEKVENVGDEIAAGRCQIYSVYSFR